MNEIIKKIVDEAELNVSEFKTKKTIAVVINIFMGFFKDYDDYLSWCQQEEQEYDKRLHQMPDFNQYAYTFSIPIEPAPVFNEKIFNYIKDFGRSYKEYGTKN